MNAIFSSNRGCYRQSNLEDEELRFNERFIKSIKVDMRLVAVIYGPQPLHAA